MTNTTVDVKIIISGTVISIKTVEFGVLANIPVNIVSMYINSFMRFHFWLVGYSIKSLMIFSISGIKDTGIPTHIWGYENMG